MRSSILLIIMVLVVLAVSTRPSLVKATHEHVKEVKFSRRTSIILNERANTKDHMIGSQVHTMSSGPSKRGSGH